MTALAAEIGGTALVLEAYMPDLAQVESCVADLVESFGPPTLMFSNAAR